MKLIDQEEAARLIRGDKIQIEADHADASYNLGCEAAARIVERIRGQEIIHCKDCKHWNLQVGNVKGNGLGSCDFHNVNLVTGEGFCYWADRRGEAE